MPDGKIFYRSATSGVNPIWTIDVDGSNPKQLSITEAFGSYTAISPDGRFAVFQKGSSATGDIGLYRTNLSDASEKQLTKGTDIWATFSPDGKWIVYTHYGERVGLWKVPTEGGEATQILDENAICPTVSPDGKQIAFVLRQRGQPDRIALVSFDGGEILRTFDVKLTKLPYTDRQKLQSTSDGRAINYVSINDGVSNIWRQPIDGSPPEQATDFKDGKIFNFAFSPDNSQLALSRGTRNSDVVLIENQK
jgi:Tol biopolymer transport system component